MRRRIYKRIIEQRENQRKSLAVLLDPQEFREADRLKHIVDLATESGIDYFFVGGSLVTDPDITDVIETVRKTSDTPLISFPGSNLQINYGVDALLFLSLISGRNPEYLIGQHVPVALSLKKSGMEVIPTGYLLVDGGRQTAVSYLSFTPPVPADKPEIAESTAVAGELLGLKLIYLDAGSGAEYPVSEAMIRQVRKALDIPLIVGGGINSTEKALKALRAGADILVVGNHLEEEPQFLRDLGGIMREFNRSLDIH